MAFVEIDGFYIHVNHIAYFYYDLDALYIQFSGGPTEQQFRIWDPDKQLYSKLRQAVTQEVCS